MLYRVLLALVLAASAPAAFAKTCSVTIDSTDQMKYSQAEIRLGGDCTQVKLTLRHTGKIAANVMGHNWVLAKTSDFRPLAIAGGKATLADSYLPKGDARAIAHTKVVGGGESTSITFPTRGLEKGGDYTFFCSFPGHWNVMKGKFVFG